MSYARLAQRLYNVPLLITADKLDVLDHVLRAYDEGRAKLLSPYEKKERPELALGGAPQLTQSGYIRTAQGVAIIPILGTMVQRTGGMDAESGLTSYGAIGGQLSAAMNDPFTRGILLEIDSSGGEANGLFDLAAEIRDAAGYKPIFAHANEQAFSAAYALASAAEAIYTPRTGMVGSIGARMRHVDQSAYDAKRGFVYTDIVSGARKADMSPHAALSDPARLFMQDHVDRLGDMFTNLVVEMRGVDEQVVRDTQAGLLHADEAIDRGLINGVATINETMQMLLTRIAEPQASSHGMRAAESAVALEITKPTGDTKMDAKELATQLAAAKAEGVTEGRTTAEADTAKRIADTQAAAATAAQERISAILGHDEAKDRQTLSKHLAFKTTQSVEDIAATLAASPKEVAAAVAGNPLAAPANLLAAAMGKVPNPQVGPGSLEGEETVESLAASIINAGKRKPLVIAK
jgi:ClpP class serine protease